jgi:hypothetical protein
MARNLTDAVAAAAHAALVRPRIFYEGEFASGTLNLWSGIGPIDWDGKTWTGAGQMLGIGMIGETSELRAVGFEVSLSGEATAMLSANLGNARQGLPGMVWLGFMEPEIVDFDFTQATLQAQVGAGVAEITFTRSGATATRVNASGLIETVAADTPRFDYDPVTLAIKGLLIEEARTNLCLQSNAFTTTWADTGGGASPVQDADGPLGAGTAWTLTDDDAGAFEGRAQSWTVANDSLIHVFSIYIEKTVSAPSAFGVNFSLSGGTGISHNIRLNTNSGNVTGGGNPFVEDKGDFWRLVCSITNNSTGNTTLSVGIFPATRANVGDTPGGPDSAAATGSAVVSAAQLEKAAFHSSYIPTTTAAVTRNADVATVSDISGFFNASEGTLVGEAITAPAWPTTQYIATFSDGTGNERLSLFRSSETAMSGLAIDGGVTQASPANSGTSNSALVRAAFAYKVNDFAASTNGSAITADTSGTLPTVSQLQIGKSGANSQAWNGHLRRFTYYPRRLSNAQLQELSGNEHGDFRYGVERIIADPFKCFEGRFDVPDIVDEGARATISARYESRLIDLDRVRARRYTDEDQKLDYPTDKGFEYVPSLQDAQIPWGNGVSTLSLAGRAIRRQQAAFNRNQSGAGGGPTI